MIRFLILLFVVALSLLIGCEDTERAESRTLLKQLKSIDVRLPVQKRKAAVARLDALILTEEKLTRVRDRCSRAHKALIRAEEQQQKAKRVMEKATALDPSARIDKPHLVVIAKAIERSNEELKRAKDTFPGCEREVRKLELRFASDRGLR